MGAGASTGKVTPQAGSEGSKGSYASGSSSTAVRQDASDSNQQQKSSPPAARQTCALYYLRKLRGPTQHELDRQRLKELEEEVERAQSDKKRFAMMLSETEAAFSQRKADLSKLSKEVMVLKATLEAALAATSSSNNNGTESNISAVGSPLETSPSQSQLQQTNTNRMQEMEKQIELLKSRLLAREEADFLAFDVLDHYAFLKSSLPRLEESAAEALIGMDEAIDRFSTAWESLKQQEHL